MQSTARRMQAVAVVRGKAQEVASPVDGVLDPVVGRLVGCLVGRSVGCLVGRSVGYSTGGVVGYLVGRLVGVLVKQSGIVETPLLHVITWKVSVERVGSMSAVR
jgi:outer membrane lipoprotein SlyB